MPGRDQLRMMRHALGLDSQGRGFPGRNHYVAGQSQLADWDELCARGLAEAVDRRVGNGLSTFRLTHAGIDEARRAA